MDEYLTTSELSKRIKMPPGSIRNLIWKKALVENIHFVRPTPRKILFKWAAIENWLNRGGFNLNPPVDQSKITI
jgi:hypothetical protein